MMKLGIIGGGQLGVMLICAAKQMNIHTTVYCDDENAPARFFSDVFITGSYVDYDRISQFASSVDIITFEFENIPYASLNEACKYTEVLPLPEINQIIQHRIREKDFVNSIPPLKTTEYVFVRTVDDIVQYLDMLPCILKTCTLGYDGKGQYRLNSKKDVDNLIQLDPTQEYILEKTVELRQEISVVLTRFGENRYEIYEPIENVHEEQILRVSEIPANISKELFQKSQEWVIALSEKLNYIGTMCVEFFVDIHGELYVNEIAPRVHNSGHLTIGTHTVNQFENHVRAVCRLEQKETKKLYNARMTNIIGEDPSSSSSSGMKIEDAFTEKAFGKDFHFDYRKGEVKPNRKMGHFTEIKELLL